MAFIFALELSIIISVSIANAMSQLGFALFYNLLYGLIISTSVPIAIVLKKHEPLKALGAKKMGSRQWAVLLIFVVASIGGQVIPKLAIGETINFYLLPQCVLPLIMTTFFEEFFFRGFVQTRAEKRFGAVAAVILSGFLFSIYHLGYPGFRTVPDIVLLFAVGIGFALSYKLSGNNLFVAYFVNLPNALLTYCLKESQFPVFTELSSVLAVITIFLIALLFAALRKRWDTPTSQA